MPVYRTGNNIYTVVQVFGQPSGGAANTAGANFGFGNMAPSYPYPLFYAWPFITPAVEDATPPVALVGSWGIPALIS